MCGLFGAVFLGPDDRVDVTAALASIAYRGPDRSKVYREDGVVLGFNRLAILDLTPAGDQPMASVDGRVVIVFNGEIYNHHELRAELLAMGHTFRSRSDTEVIVEGFRAWGERVIERLDGMFAIGIYDRRERRLVLARDRAGKKPLFYTTAARGGFRFASEPKAILASGVAAEMDVNALPMLLAMGYPLAPQSMYRGIAELPPASRLVIEEGGTPRVTTYWEPPFTSDPITPDVPEAIAEVRRLTEAAVVRRLEADVGLGAFLSGGLDSSIVVALMAKHADRKVKTFSIGFSANPRFDESHYARVAARAFGTDHVEFSLDPPTHDLIRRLVHLYDGPFGDSSAVPTSIVSMLTKKYVTVALTGDGGDELFCGYTRFLAIEAAERIPPSIRALGAAASELVPESSGAAVKRARRFVSKASLGLADRSLAWISLFASELDEMLTPEVHRELRVDEPFVKNRQLFAASRGASVLSRVLDHNFRTYLPSDLLLKADRASMLHSLELRSPFLDTALIEYVARLPDAYKRRGLQTKWILRRAFRDLIPDEIRNRSKKGFGMPLGAWFRRDLRDVLLSELGPTAALYTYVRRPFVDRLLHEHFEGIADHGHRLWLLLTLEIWLSSLRMN